MPKTVHPSAQVSVPETTVYFEDLEAAIHDTLANLANVDRVYDQRRQADAKKEEKNFRALVLQKKRLRVELDTMHRKDRQPYVLRLADLHYRPRMSLFKTLH